MKKSGFVAVVGRPNSGKSTLMNTICGTKVAIVSHIPQTTRNVIRGIYTKKDSQIVFLDTPGIHESIKMYNKMLSKQAEIAIGDADQVLYVIDLTRPYGREEEAVIKILSTIDKPIYIAFNKIDVVSKDVVENSVMYQDIVKEVPNASLHYISALKQKNIDDLLEDILSHLPEAEFFYPEDSITDQTLQFQVGEVIREKVMKNTYEEIPHAVKVEVTEIDDESKQDLISIRAEIHIERDSQKGVVIGKGGKKLKEIGTYARKDLEKLFNKRVFLDLQVKVDKKWRTQGG